MDAQDESVCKSWARFSHELHRSPDAPYPGMSEAFEQHFSQSFTDREWRAEASTWAAAWKAAKRHRPHPAPSVPEGFSREDLEAVADGLDGYEKTVNVGNVTGEGDDHLESTTAYAARFIRAMLAAAPEAKP